MAAAPAAAPAHIYEPRRPEQTLLYPAVRDHLEPFLAKCAEADRPVPAFVEKELRAFLDCGRVELGAVRVHCPACGFDRLVPFSCKGRGGICPSCGARRMAELAAQLVDHVLPRAPYRQYVLTLPFPPAATCWPTTPRSAPYAVRQRAPDPRPDPA